MKENINKNYELVGSGHPDKLCDWIADLICQKILDKDCNAKVAIEVMGCGDQINVCGEVKSKLEIDSQFKQMIAYLVENKLDRKNLVFDWCIRSQYANITSHVEKKDGHIGAGDQGICIGYACRDTKEMLPQEQKIAHLFFDWIENKKWELKHKSKLTQYEKWFLGFGNDKKFLITTCFKQTVDIIFATQNQYGFKKKMVDELIYDIMGLGFFGFYRNAIDKEAIHISSIWKEGGFKSDTGLTGRKIASDNFANCQNGGGAFSGKDWTKVDRTGTYYARYLAKNILAKNPKLNEVVVKLIYKIGDEYPLIFVNGESKQEDLKPYLWSLTRIINLWQPKVKLDEITNNHWQQHLPWEQTDLFLPKIEGDKDE